VSVTSLKRKPLLGTVVVPRDSPTSSRSYGRHTASRRSLDSSNHQRCLTWGGIYLGLESNRLYDELKADRNASILVRDDSRGTRGKVYSIGADIAFLGSGVLGGLATYNFLKDPLPPSRLDIGKVREFDNKSKVPAPGGAP